MIKKTLVFAAAVAAAFSFATPAAAQSRLALSNYTYTPGKKVIGQVVSRDAALSGAKVQVVGENASHFAIDGKNQLVVRKVFPGPESSKWQDVVLELRKGQELARDTFRIVRDAFIVNKVIAHRGAWKNTGETENSLGALRQAIALGCAGSEFDVHMSADRVPFVNHDHTLQGVHLEKAPAAELVRIKLPNGEPLPTLEAYLREGTQQNDTRLILEIKASSISKARSLELTEVVVGLVRKHRAQGWVDYISFDYDVLQKVKELEPHAKVAYLNGDKAPEALAQDRHYGLDYHFSVMKKNPHWFAEARQKNLTVNVWTVNDEPTMDWLLENQADFITTNEPELLLQKVKKVAGR
jgi:glycerophosphoryl diester phosphodiesterase